MLKFQSLILVHLLEMCKAVYPSEQSRAVEQDRNADTLALVWHVS